MLHETLKYCKGDGKVTFTRPFLMLDNVPFDVLERYCKGNVSYTLTNLNGSLPKVRDP